MLSTQLWPFIGALVLVYLVPGADMLLVLDTATARGRRAALAAAGGLAAARAAHVSLAGLGLATLLVQAPGALTAVSLAGAAYLAWLALQILRAPALQALGDAKATPGAALAAAFRRGLLTNLLNPKALLFCSLLLPQFLAPERDGLALQFLLLGAILVGVGLAFDALYALAGARLAPWLAARPGLQRLQRGLFAALLLLFALRLVLPQG